MISVVQFNFVDGKSGKITFTPPASYVAATGYASCQTGRNITTGANWRAFFNFDTSSIQDHALITKVEFLIRLNTFQLEGDPDIYRLKFSIGTFIGAALDGNSSEFNAGTLMVTLNARPTDNTWLDLEQDGNNPKPYLNRAGDTDIKVWDDSIQGSGPSSWGTNFNTAKVKCKLRVTYMVPTAKATGRGTVSVSATVTVAGQATGTGRGTIQISAAVTAAGSASATGRGTTTASAAVSAVGRTTATGRGTAEGSATVTAAASFTATGRGTVELSATVQAAGSITVTGRGTAEASAIVSTIGASSATGRGTAELVATVTATGGAGATGRGFAEVTAFITVSALATATGRGTAFCHGQVETRTASATATGRGFASCRLTAAYFEPPARHLGTRIVRARHAAVRSVEPADERTCVAGGVS